MRKMFIEKSRSLSFHLQELDHPIADHFISLSVFVNENVVLFSEIFLFRLSDSMFSLVFYASKPVRLLQTASSYAHSTGTILLLSLQKASTDDRIGACTT